ncbi:MAG: HD domain-containing protein [Parachlamydiales bacterium]|nr:HD domain-containing protein [Verrucomicrobiota bacterium]MBX3719852.1 HD domain-containing protein [Candidatus Acheromyda pituitae]
MTYNPAYTKKIYDAVHGFIRFNELERELIDSDPFQRLHYLHQLGISFLVYPGATHTRFEHSLGAMELATRIFDRIASKHSRTDVDLDYWRQIIRLAALCHDLGHLPFSHVAEKVLLGKGGHEKWTLAVIQSDQLKSIWDKLQKRHPERNVTSDLIKMALGAKKAEEIGLDLPFTPWEKVMTEVITGDFFGADRIDYLLRDAQCTGVSYGLFDYHQLIEMLCILPTPGDPKGSLELGIEENGMESCEALLLARHFMHQRVYQYSSSKAYSFHLARFMKQFYSQGNYLESLDAYLTMTDNEVLSALRRAAIEPNALGHADARALLKRHDRFLAIELKKGIGEENLKKLQQLLAIASDAISWNLAKEKLDDRPPTFPVLKRSGAIVDSSQCSKILIPTGSQSWVFIAPAFERPFREALEEITSP